MYADYDYYFNAFFGSKIDGESFPRLAQKASDYLDYLTQGRAAKECCNDKLKRACCAMAEIYQEIDNCEALNAGGEIASESVGSHSVSYRSNAETLTALNKKLVDAARMYLAGTGLLYRGIGCIRHI